MNEQLALRADSVYRPVVFVAEDLKQQGALPSGTGSSGGMARNTEHRVDTECAGLCANTRSGAETRASTSLVPALQVSSFREDVM